MRRVLFAIFCLVANCAVAQQVITVNDNKLAPEVRLAQQRLSEQIAKEMGKIDWSNVRRKTTGGSALFTVPVVVHVIHDYGQELVPDTAIYQFINTMNAYFLKTNPDTISIIDKYRNVAASTQIAFKLATIAPDGSATKGIDHISSYLTYNATDQAKIRQWPQDKYLNVWIINSFPGPAVTAFTYSTYSSLLAAYYPYYDGVMVAYGFLSLPGGAKSKCFAKFLNLPSPCSYGCFDGDGIPDTPPCDYSVTPLCSNVYTVPCDTPNVQNIMTNADACGLMFTYGQGQYMQYILQIDIGKRDSLITPYNSAHTGINILMPDLYPVADFSVKNLGNKLCHFFCAGQPVIFKNCSWNDTITAAAWTFSNAPFLSTSSSLSAVTNRFYAPGWVTVSLAATGNNTGTSSINDANALYIADSVATPGSGYLQEFDAATMSNWPVFNYYKNNFKWQTSPVGCYDNSSIMYTGYDDRPFPQNMAGGPRGDYDDIFTPAFDLTGFGSSCYLNFFSSAATITSNPHFMNDTLEISYSIDHSNTWVPLKQITKNELLNKGTITTPYTPAAASDWMLQSIAVPAVARAPFVFFRFRFHPGVDSTGKSTSNNFYLDHFNFNQFPETVDHINLRGESATVFPNPATHSTKVFIRSTSALDRVIIQVTDVTGKVIYSTSLEHVRSYAEMEIPENVFGEKGLFFVRIATEKNVFTEKLILY